MNNEVFGVHFISTEPATFSTEDLLDYIHLSNSKK